MRGKNEKPRKKQSPASEEPSDESEGETSKKPKMSRKNKKPGKNEKPRKKQSSASEEQSDESEGETSKKPKRSGKNKKPPKEQSSASEEPSDESEGETSKKPKRSGKKKEHSMGLQDKLKVEGEISKNCCIYAVPETLADNNTKKAYVPRVVSIGPIHGDEKQVQAMKKHKRQFLDHLHHRTQKSSKDLLKSISSLEKEARECYSKEIKLESTNQSFLETMVEDGCFLIELFRKADKVEKVFERDDSLATMAWAVPYIYGDLLLVANQIPFFVMEELFQTSKMPGDSDASLSLLALQFFNKVMQRPDKFHKRLTSNDIQKPLHLLDLVRSSLLLQDRPHQEEETRIATSNSEPSNQPDQEETRIPISNSEPSNKRNDLIYCISKLRRAGIELRRRDADSFLDVKFRKGILENSVIQMPNITMNNHMKNFLVNCVAFEQLHNTPSKQFTVYARLLNCLVKTAKDVDYLCHNDIFVNYIGKDSDIVRFINKMGKDLAFDEDQFYLSQLFKEVNACYGTDWKTKRSGMNEKPPKKQSSASEEPSDESAGETSENPDTEKEESQDELEVEGEISKNCCIYAVPKTLADNNTKKAYEPRVVSIGPNHVGEKQVQAMKKHKLQFLHHLRHRRQISLENLLESISSLEKEARECYSKEIKLESTNQSFLETMVVDGCFLIELFRKADKVEKVFERDDPLATMAWAVPYIYGDLLLVANQIPFFVMEELFQTSKMPGDSDASLSLLALQFFNKVMQRPDGVIDNFLKRATRNNYPKPLHLLDLVRSSLLLQPDQEETRIAISNSKPSNKKNDLICCISKLRRAGIKLRGRDADSFLDVKFRKGIFGNGVIEMPNITMHYHLKSFLVNCVAFEQLHNSPYKQFTVYARLLDCLVNTAKDVDYLCDNEIFDNYFGKDGDIVQFINKMGKDLSFDDEQFYLFQLFEDVNECYSSTINRQVASCKLRYFNTPWSLISALAALVLLVFTFLQTYYTIYAYVNPN